MLVRYWQAALIAAFMTLFGNVVWAQDSCPRHCGDSGCVSSSYRPYCTKGGCQATKSCCESSECCKDGKCCANQKCDKKCICCAESKCDCTKGGECCCKKGECKCGKSCKCCGEETATCTKEGCCPFLSKLAKKVAILMVMPSPRYVNHPPMYFPPSPPFPVPHVALPGMPPPPMMAPPGMPIMPPQMVTLPAPSICHPAAPASITMTAPMPAKVDERAGTYCQAAGLSGDLCSFVRTPSVPALCGSPMNLMVDLCPIVCGQSCAPCAMPASPCSPGCGQCGSSANVGYIHCHEGPCGNTIWAAGQPAVCMECVASPAAPAKLHILAASSSDELEMNVAGSSIRCKKMTITIGDHELTLSRFDDRVRVRSDELKATAANIRSEGKDRLILEGDVVLHHEKHGNAAKFTGDHIELNLSSGAVTIKPAAKTPSYPAESIDRIEPNQ